MVLFFETHAADLNMLEMQIKFKGLLGKAPEVDLFSVSREAKAFLPLSLVMAHQLCQLTLQAWLTESSYARLVSYRVS